MKTNIHIGQLIKERFDASGMTISSFAEAIHKTRTTIYDIFKRQSIDMELLMLISDVLDYDFIERIYMMRKDQTDESKKKRYFVCVEVNEKNADITKPDNIKILSVKEQYLD